MSDYTGAESQMASTHPQGGEGGGEMMLFTVELYNNKVDLWYWEKKT